LAEVGFKGVSRLLPPDQWVERQINNLQKVGRANYIVGISAPKKDTIKEGIKAEGKYANELSAAIAEKRRAKALETVSLEDWFHYASVLGADRLVPGVTQRRAKVEKFVNGWQPMLLEHVKKLDEMGVDTLEDRIRKMEANVRGLVALKGKWRRRG